MSVRRYTHACTIFSLSDGDRPGAQRADPAFVRAGHHTVIPVDQERTVPSVLFLPGVQSFVQKILVQADDHDPAAFFQIPVINDPVGNVEQIMVFSRKMSGVFRGKEMVAVIFGDRIIEGLLVHMEVLQPRAFVGSGLQGMCRDHFSAVREHDFLLGRAGSILDRPFQRLCENREC